MIARLMPILSLIATVAVGVLLYQQGVLERLFQPYVSVAVADRDLAPGAPVAPDMLTARRVAVTALVPGALTFPEGADDADIVATLGGQVIAAPVPEGNALTAQMIGQTSGVAILRAIDTIAAGAALSMNNLEPEKLTGTVPDGAVTFETAQDAFTYLNNAYDLVARTSLTSGEIVSIDTIVSGADKLYGIQALVDVEAGARFDIAELEPVAISGRTMPVGTLAFRTAEDVRAYLGGEIAGEVGIAARVDIAARDILTIADIETGAGAAPREASGDPRTVAELEAFMEANPGRAMRVNEDNMIGQGPDAGGRVDLWVEQARTEGAFGTIRLRRIATDVPLRMAVREDVEGIGPVSRDTRIASEGSAFWIRTDPTTVFRFDGVRAAGAIAFAIDSDADLVAELGNGVTCTGPVCRADRTTSADLARVEDQIAFSGGMGAAEDSPLVLFEGVDARIAAALTVSGLERVDDLADLTDGRIEALAGEVDIDTAVLGSVREQARALRDARQQARRTLDRAALPDG